MIITDIMLRSQYQAQFHRIRFHLCSNITCLRDKTAWNPGSLSLSLSLTRALSLLLSLVLSPYISHSLPLTLLYTSPRCTLFPSLCFLSYLSLSYSLSLDPKQGIKSKGGNTKTSLFGLNTSNGSLLSSM